VCGVTTEQLLEMAEVRRRAGDETGALALLGEAAVQAKANFEPALEAQAMLGTGQLLTLGGNDKAARSVFEEAVARAMEGGDVVTEADAHFALATLAFDSGRSKDGHDALLEAMALCRDQDTLDGKRRLARAVRLYGEHIGVLGSAEDARQALELAWVMFDDLGDAQAAAGVRADIVKLQEFSR
jgi:hypothetical protein